MIISQVCLCQIPYKRIKTITTLLYIKRACELNKSHIISTDEDPGLRIESFAVIHLRGGSTNKTMICFIAMQTYKELNYYLVEIIDHAFI
jgi:hypothetical protein